MADAEADLAEIAGQRIFTSQPFGGYPIGVRFQGLYAVYDDGQLVTVCIIYSDDLNYNHGQPLKVDPLTIHLPRALFNSDEQLLDWCQRVHGDFQRLWHKVMVVESEQHFRDAANFHLGQMGIAPIDLPAIVRAHQDFIEDELKARFHLPDAPIRRRRGQFSKWTEAELLTEVRAILNILKPMRRTYDEVNKRLRERHPNRPIKNGESLRKLLSSYGYTLTKIKQDSAGE